MYIIILILLLLISGFILYKGIMNKKKSIIFLGATLAILSLLFFAFMSFWGEMLWFENLGYNNRFWKVWLTKKGLFVISFLFSGFVIYLFTYNLKNQNKYIRYLALLLGAFIGGAWWHSRWDIFLKFIFQTPTETIEPILGMSTGFYLFNYPFLISLYQLLLYLSIIAAGANLVGIFSTSQNNQKWIEKELSPSHSLFLSVGIIFIILALGQYLKRYGLLFSTQGAVHGPGWTDHYVRLPLLLVNAGLFIFFGIVMISPLARTWFQKNIFRIKSKQNNIRAIYTIPGTAVLLWIIILGITPGLFQWLKVEPNEITVERPYIENNIQFTRKGYHLDKVEVKEFPAREEFSRKDIEQNKKLFSNIRLWDYRALDAIFKQFQEIRLYYEFNDVDIDRYHINDEYREVMISGREMNADNLPAKSQTFINKKFKYTHGYGAVLNLVNEFTSSGLPNLLIKDIPPVSKYRELKITQPEIYYGELTHKYVVVNSKEDEFDYPMGEKNIYTKYKGDGGIQLTNGWRKFLYGWKLGGTRFLFSGYPTKESRIMFHRQILDRVKTIAPFLQFDADPYIVMNNGQLYWIIDAYTTSNYYPYSEPFKSVGRNDKIGFSQNSEHLLSRSVLNNNYLRNSVKITVNAFNGDTKFYIFEEDDPLVQVYNKIFPGLLKSKDEMPTDLKAHVRYPSDMLQVQGLIYSKYHMTDPTVFYNQEDLWVRATEKYYNNVQPVEPYYIMWEQPESDEMQFILMLPFTPKNKQVMIGWIAGMCDGDDYGRFLAYKFPKEKRVLGTQQVETKIDQDSFLSGQLTLWDQRGSNVIRGNVLAIPINQTMLYVEPIYLKSQTAAYPELRLVAVMHNDKLSYAETFDQALNNLFEGDAKESLDAAEFATTGKNVNELIQDANQAFENYLKFMHQKQFNSAANELNKLQKTLEQLKDDNKDPEM